MQELQTVSMKNKAPQEMRDTFIAAITAWMDDKQLPDLDILLPNASRHLLQPFRSRQKTVGFKSFMGDLLSLGHPLSTTQSMRMKVHKLNMPAWKRGGHKLRWSYGGTFYNCGEPTTIWNKARIQKNNLSFEGEN